VTLRVYSQRDQPELVDVEITLTAAEGAPARHIVRAGDLQKRGQVRASSLVSQANLCVPGRSAADVKVTTTSGATMPGPPITFQPGKIRRVGARIGPISMNFTGRSCTV